MAERVIYHVVPEDGGEWKITRVGGSVTSFFATRREAVAAARRLGRQHELAQVIVHALDGRIEAEWTYGDDPRRHVV